MPRFWPMTLAVLIAGCGGGSLPMQTGMPPTMPGPNGAMPNGMIDPTGGGGLDPSLLQPLAGSAGGGLGGDLFGGGLFDSGGGFGQSGFGGGLGAGMGGMGGGLLGGSPAFGISSAMGLGMPSDPSGLPGASAGLTSGSGDLMGSGPGMPSLSEAMGQAGVAGTGSDSTATATADNSASASEGPLAGPAASQTTGPADGTTSAESGPVLISSRFHANPDDARVQTQPDANGVDVTLVVPLTGEVTLSPADAAGDHGQATSLTVAGTTTGRLRLSKLGPNLWKPAGISTLVGVSAETPDFQITGLTITPAGAPPWHITNPAAITAFDHLPNIPSGTPVTVSVTVAGDTAHALPVLYANGKLMRLQPATGGESSEGQENTATFTRQFTLAPLTLTKDKMTLSKDVGLIAVKVVETKEEPASEGRISARAISWSVWFPSQTAGKGQGTAGLPATGRLSHLVQTLLTLIQAHEEAPTTVKL